jgi:hypothetical protein
MGINEEIEAFIQQTIDKFEEAAKKESIKHFIRDTWLYPITHETLKDIYLQMKYVCEAIDRICILPQTYNEEEAVLIYRRGMILNKILFSPWFQIDLEQLRNHLVKPRFEWQEYKTELEMEEYFDMILSEIGFIFERYYSDLENCKVLDCDKLAKSIGISGSITNRKVLEALYLKLSEMTTQHYGIRTLSLFPPKFYDVRNSIFHLDYYYTYDQKGGFKIYLNSRRDIEIGLVELIKLTQDIISKNNVYKIVGNYFSNEKNGLPLKGF